MTNPLVTTEIVRSAELLAAIDGDEYRAVPLVFRLNGKGTPSFYCALPDWPKTEAGRIAVYNAEIERLKARIAELEAGQEGKGIDVPSVLEVQPALTCPYCPDAPPFKRRNGLSAHMRIKHGEKV